ncbi:MAG: DUF4124 domain-containing protein [Betaproteobacteria bacterium]|nr:DUF4124 domain-containing protein [Betaproteobacteria bacterium]
MRAAISLSLLFLAFWLAPASAQVFKCVDAVGKITYRNDRVPGKGCKPISTEQSVSTINMRPNSSSTTFPRVSGEAQRERDNARRRVLERELDSEQKELEDARSKLIEQEGIFQNGEVFINPKTGARGANPQKKLDRLQPYKDAVERRERNVEALNQELSGLR